MQENELLNTEESENRDKDPMEGLLSIVPREKARYTTVGEMVLNILRSAIHMGSLSPGQHLRQDKLAEALDVSRMPIRNALLQLEGEGLVTFYPHRGAMVATLPTDEIVELFQIRGLLEGYALREAIYSITPDRLEHLESLATELDTASSGEPFAELSMKFYRHLYDEERHPTLVRLITQLHINVGRYLLGHRVPRHRQSAHQTLLTYVRLGQAEEAVAWLESHLENVSAHLQDLINGVGETRSK